LVSEHFGTQSKPLCRPLRGAQQIARNLWRELTPELCRLRLLTKLDLKLLETYCEEYATFRKASAFIGERAQSRRASLLNLICSTKPWPVATP